MKLSLNHIFSVKNRILKQILSETTLLGCFHDHCVCCCSGVVFDGKELQYIEKATNSSNIHDTNHFLYSHSDLVTNHTCGKLLFVVDEDFVNFFITRTFDTTTVSYTKPAKHLEVLWAHACLNGGPLLLIFGYSDINLELVLHTFVNTGLDLPIGLDLRVLGVQCARSYKFFSIGSKKFKGFLVLHKIAHS